jgi:hypothetical protein
MLSRCELLRDNGQTLFILIIASTHIPPRIRTNTLTAWQHDTAAWNGASDSSSSDQELPIHLLDQVRDRGSARECFDRPNLE